MIPKILHQVWLGPKPIPKQFLHWMGGWRSLHPDWTYILHTNENVPKHLKYYIDSCKYYSSKSNIIRLYVINKYGGIYCDTNFEWNKNINCFLDNNFITAKQQSTTYSNAFFGSVSNSPILNWQLNLLDKYIDHPQSGVNLFTSAIEKFEKDVKVLPTKYIYPYLWNKPFTPGIHFPNPYLVNHWKKS